jgi:hypothetical protein
LNTWLAYLLVVGAGLALARIYFNVKKLKDAAKSDSYDARIIERLRAAGSDPFQPHAVDFFFALPNEQAYGAVASELERDGFSVDSHSMPDSTDLPLSLHASKLIRLSVPEMKELSQRFTQLATRNGGRYDGWTAGHVPKSV